MGREGTENRQPLLTDAQVDDNEKHVGGTIFSKEGKGKGANHHQYGGNILFTDGSTVEIGTEAQIEMTHQAGIKLLNPK